jgi:hypothetical protein
VFDFKRFTQRNFLMLASSPSKGHPKPEEQVIPANSDEKHSQSTVESKKGIGGEKRTSPGLFKFKRVL